MSNYSFSVAWSEADGEYVATSAEFPGLSGLGPTAEDAVRELRAAMDVAVEAFIEDEEEVPEPRYLPEFSGQFRLRVPTSLHAHLAAYAESEGVSLNTLAVTLLSQGIGAAALATKVAHQLRDAVSAPAVAAGYGIGGVRTPSAGTHAIVPPPAEPSRRETRVLPFSGRSDPAPEVG